MKQRTYSLKTVAGAFLCGSVFFSGLAYAASQHVEIHTDRLGFFVKGVDKTSADGVFDNGGTKVPESFLYGGTTYVPVRKAAELLGDVYWDAGTRAVSIGTPYVTLFNAKGEPAGHATLNQDPDGVKMRIQVSGLTPGKHGIHIHEKTIEGYDFQSAGGHFNPDAKKHGLSNAEGHHVGDLRNLEVGTDGKAEAEIPIQGGTLAKNDPFSLLGRSVVIHEKEDDELTDPAGNSGDRVVGGNIPE